MVYLFAFIVIGYLLAKIRAVPIETAGVLSKLESKLFSPALALGTFMNNFTPEKLGKYGTVLLLSIALLAVVIPSAILVSRIIFGSDEYMKN